MVHNEKMDAKLEELTSNWKNITKKKMFGGTGYLMNGKMVAGIYKDYYILRLGEQNGKKALNNAKFRLLDITGRPMKGWIMARQDAFENDDDLISWVKKAKEFVDTLPRK